VSFVSFLECPKSGERLDPSVPRNLSAVGAPLLVRYDLAAVKQAIRKEQVASRPRGIWRFEELLPPADPANRV
jgi:threonine synthase